MLRMHDVNEIDNILRENCTMASYAVGPNPPPGGLCHYSDTQACCVDILYIPTEVLNWSFDRLVSYLTPITSDPAVFFRRWDVDRVMFDMAQLLDYSENACFYISVNNSHRHDKWKTRICSGVNRNPVETIASKNRRYGNSHVNDGQGWKLLVYVILPKNKYNKRAVDELREQIARIRGLEAKVIHLIDFAMKRGVRLRLDSSMICTKDHWYMKSVQKYISKQPLFVEYINQVKGRSR